MTAPRFTIHEYGASHGHAVGYGPYEGNRMSFAGKRVTFNKSQEADLEPDCPKRAAFIDELLRKLRCATQ